MCLSSVLIKSSHQGYNFALHSEFENAAAFEQYTQDERYKQLDVVATPLISSEFFLRNPDTAFRICIRADFNRGDCL